MQTNPLEQLQLDIQLNYFNNLLKQAKKNKLDASIIKKKINDLNEDDLNDDTITNTETDRTFSDDYVYKKSWNKLNNVHKIIKIREFVNKLLIDNEKDKNKLKKKLITLVKNKSITKKKSVNYDSVNGRIVSIPILEYKNHKYQIKN